MMKQQIIAQAKQTLCLEAEAINALIERIDNAFVAACERILTTNGRIVVIGMGKSGHIGNKIAATLASTGTPAFFVHPAEASHGDLGMITADDLLLAISNSGETEEVVTILPVIKRLGVPMIAMTGNAQSSLARQADVHLDIGVEKEACPLNLAPTSSTTATLALGDALAVALLDARGFNAEDFARSHPGGKLGKRLLTYVKDIMRPFDGLPVATPDTSLLQAIVVMSDGGLGMVMVCEHDGEGERILGVFTDGDLRRLFEGQSTHHQSTSHQSGQNFDLSHMLLRDYMHRQPLFIGQDALAAEALQIMEAHKVSALPVIDDFDIDDLDKATATEAGQGAEKGRLVGALNMHDLLRAGIV